MCTSTPATGTPVVPPTLVDLDELSMLISRCESLALGLEIILTGSGLPNGPEREGLCYELTSIIEESTKRASRLVSALY